MPKIKTKYTDLKGKQIGYLTVLGRVRRAKGKPLKWRCQCVCGKRLTVVHYRLTHQEPKTHCGCKSGGLPTHYKLTYISWSMMRERCNNPKHVAYKTYGGRGIKVCPEWDDKEKGFEQFLKDMGPRGSKKLSLDRIDSNKGYYPENTRWATKKQQSRNKRNTKKFIHPKTGELAPAAQIAEDLNLTYNQFRNSMIKKGKW